MKFFFCILTCLMLFSCIAEEKATNAPEIGDYSFCVETINQTESLYVVKEGCYRFAPNIEVENHFANKGVVKIRFEVSKASQAELTKIKAELASVPFVLQVNVTRLD